MKLPGITYDRPVQSLARRDSSLPLALANVQAATALRLGGLFRKIEANETAGIAAQFQTEMAELNANITNRKSFHIDELDQLEIKYSDKYGGERLQEVPSYLVGTEVYKNLSREIYNKHIAGTSGKTRAVISKMYGGMYKTGVTSIIKSSMEEAYNMRSIVTEMDFDAAVASGNEVAARIISETALGSGLWDADKYFAKTKNMPDKIGHANYLNDLDRSEDSVILNQRQSMMLDDPNLNPSTKNSLYRSYETKIKALETESNKIADESKKKVSYDTFANNATNILKNGEPMGWPEMNRLVHNMEPTDGKGLITLNRMVAEKGIVTDQKKYSELIVRIKALSLPVRGTTIHQRRAAAVSDLISVSGYDPYTMQRIGPSKISPDDFRTLFNEINKSQAFVYENPEVKRVSDQMWTSLTGGTKNMVTSFLGAGPDVVNAVLAEQEMLSAARNIGPSFNPDAWWKQNGAKYMTSALEENLQTMKENRIDKYIINDLNDPGLMSMGKTAQGIADRVKARTMTQEDADKAMKDIEDIYRLRLQRMQLMKTQKEAQ